MPLFQFMDGATGLEIAVVGMAGRFPGACDLDGFWRNLRDGNDAVTNFSEDELLASGVERTVFEQPRYVRARAVLEDADLFDAGFFGYHPRDAQILDPQQRVFLESAWEALESAGYDPARFAGAIGVFAGATSNGYLSLLTSDPHIVAATDPFQLAFATEKDFLATRVSYVLGLTGPSYTVQTACSTSLVATHLASQSLLNGECDMALAGGVSITLPQRAGYISTPGGVLSPDGHCRAFDSAAAGTVGGDGVGIVVLRRLEDALADGDAIRAVIRGSAINNDGRRKVGFTAPSVDGQARVIRAAHVAAEIEPESISYVEAHGTATPLGDPIEVAALTKAFREGTEKRGFCAIGSVKTNVGHLDAAAGVAGLIKTILALEHRELPPSLHFERPNPDIGFATSPFYVNARRRPWHPGKARRAGVSSFGIGGTNAHAILEEAPSRDGSPSGRTSQLLAISGRTPGARDATRAALAAHLSAHSDLELADVAYTLHVGRRHFDHRAAFVCGSPAEAAAALRGEAPERAVPPTPYLADRPVVFMFPGGGAQHAGMAADVYREHPVFRAELDRCADFLRAELGLDLRDALGDAAVDSNAVFPAALFAVEYALARLWLHLGVEPEAMIGHSLGEYAAACLAGVFSLEDALALIAVRGRLFDRVPAGAMLSVALPPDELQREMNAGVDLAAVNAPRLSVASGSPDDIATLEERLAARGVETRRLQIGVAAHSRDIDAVSSEFRRFVAAAALRPPTRRIVSNVTGTWLTPSEACDPDYWTAQLRRTVRFSMGIAGLLRRPQRMFLEVGPGLALSSLVRQHGAPGQVPLALASLPHARDERSSAAFLLATAGRLWMAGAEIRWPSFYTGETRRRVRLPSRPFERRRHWIGASPGDAPAPPSAAVAAPADGIEQQIADLWRRLFGIDEISRHDDFFELGGHSLMATRLLTALNTAFDVELSVGDLVRASTVERLASAVKRAARGAPVAHLPVLDLETEARLDDDIVARPVRRNGRPARSAVLLTGATGYLGAHLLHELLLRTDGDVVCLVRGDAARLRTTLEGYGAWEEAHADRIIALAGDLGASRLALSDDRFADLGQRVHAIYHCGADVHFTYPYARLSKVNVDGTREILRLAAHGGPLPVHHVSTTAVFTAADGVIAEDDELPDVNRLVTGYAQSKWVAEQLAGMARERGIPVSIYRPGAVLGSTRTGSCRADDAVWRLLKSCLQLGVAPEVDAELAGAPVDYVASAIVEIAARPETLGGTYHLTAPSASGFQQLFDFARELGYPLQAVDYPSWREQVAASRNEDDNALFPLLHLLDGARSATRFSCSRSQAALAGSGVACPPLEPVLLGRYFDHFVRSGFLPSPSTLNQRRNT